MDDLIIKTSADTKNNRYYFFPNDYILTACITLFFVFMNSDMFKERFVCQILNLIKMDQTPINITLISIVLFFIIVRILLIKG